MCEIFSLYLFRRWLFLLLTWVTLPEHILFLFPVFIISFFFLSYRVLMVSSSRLSHARNNSTNFAARWFPSEQLEKPAKMNEIHPFRNVSERLAKLMSFTVRFFCLLKRDEEERWTTTFLPRRVNCYLNRYDHWSFHSFLLFFFYSLVILFWKDHVMKRDNKFWLNRRFIGFWFARLKLASKRLVDSKRFSYCACLKSH